MIHRLTSAGHDFCDGIRQDTIWNKAKNTLLNRARLMAFQCLLSG